MLSLRSMRRFRSFPELAAFGNPAAGFRDPSAIDESVADLFVENHAVGHKNEARILDGRMQGQFFLRA